MQHAKRDNDPVWALAFLMLSGAGCAAKPFRDLQLEQYAEWLPTAIMAACVLFCTWLLLAMWFHIRREETHTQHVCNENAQLRNQLNRCTKAIVKYETERNV